MRLIITILILCALALLAGLLVKSCHRKAEYKKTGRHHYTNAQIPVLDTVRVKQLAPVVFHKTVVVPSLTKVQILPDTLMRKQAEKKTIVVSVRRQKALRKGLFKRTVGEDSLYVRLVNPKGIVLENSYPARWVDTGKWQVDSTGLHINPDEFAADQKHARRKEKLRKIGRTVVKVILTAGVGFCSFQVGRAL